MAGLEPARAFYGPTDFKSYCKSKSSLVKSFFGVDGCQKTAKFIPDELESLAAHP
jgi:hypothetical protein